MYRNPSMGFSRQECWSGVPLTTIYKIKKDLLYSTGNSTQHFLLPVIVFLLAKGGNIS